MKNLFKNMKNLLVVVLIACSLNGFAQKKELIWHTDVNKAIKISTETNKPLFLFFTGSDWCGWCKRLVKEVFIKPEFAAWANKNLVLVELDFNSATRRKIQAARAGKATLTKQEQEMLELQGAFGVRGYPTGWFVIPKPENGKVNLNNKLGSQGYVAGGPGAWIAGANNIIKNK
tara:strand:- start:9899 stop:10420 length:522 start_codon:yes stop_codon:yes gene_type:complete